MLDGRALLIEWACGWSVSRAALRACLGDACSLYHPNAGSGVRPSLCRAARRVLARVVDVGAAVLAEVHDSSGVVASSACLGREAGTGSPMMPEPSPGTAVADWRQW
jgi:hypothetical protein